VPAARSSPAEDWNGIRTASHRSAGDQAKDAKDVFVERRSLALTSAISALLQSSDEVGATFAALSCAAGQGCSAFHEAIGNLRM
jgi:hypothetical protein